MPPLLAVKFIAPEPGLTSSGLTLVPMLLPAITVIAPLLALVSISVPAVPLVTFPAAFNVTAPAVNVVAPENAMSPAVVVNCTVPVPAEIASAPDSVIAPPAVNATLPLLVVMPVVEEKPVAAPTVPSPNAPLST